MFFFGCIIFIVCNERFIVFPVDIISNLFGFMFFKTLFPVVFVVFLRENIMDNKATKKNGRIFIVGFLMFKNNEFKNIVPKILYILITNDKSAGINSNAFIVSSHRTQQFQILNFVPLYNSLE